ncbi:MAG: hypothetical protein J7604_26240 [Sporocytophaga sp.]|uniref:hypothetical protein n=1 Tax=Sporocytophaga sp. TaxID=2231183 RepID=UPI001B1DFBA8|nr:hypothetical protein [Sporocytophaga sp.]MBO9703733.1 hypothetical protein [Sporocytophaga sp.]
MKINQILLAVIMTMFTACSKKEDVSPSGNDNVKVYIYGSKTFTGATEYAISDISQIMMDSSLVLAYYNPSSESPTTWYPVPGLGSGSLYETRGYVYKSVVTPNTYSYTVKLVDSWDNTTSYATPVTFTKFKVFIIPASTVVKVQRKGTSPDVSDYDAVKEYYNISE